MVLVQIIQYKMSRLVRKPRIQTGPTQTGVLDSIIKIIHASSEDERET